MKDASASDTDAAVEDTRSLIPTQRVGQSTPSTLQDREGWVQQWVLIHGWLDGVLKLTTVVVVILAGFERTLASVLATASITVATVTNLRTKHAQRKTDFYRRAYERQLASQDHMNVLCSCVRLQAFMDTAITRLRNEPHTASPSTVGRDTEILANFVQGALPAKQEIFSQGARTLRRWHEFKTYAHDERKRALDTLESALAVVVEVEQKVRKAQQDDTRGNI